MPHLINLKKLSFLVYGLGSSGLSVIKYLKKNKINNFLVWDDNIQLRNKFSSKKFVKLNHILRKVDYIILSPGISLRKTKNKKDLIKFKKKIITDIDLLYLSNPNFKSIVVTGSNGKSTTCKIIFHLLKKNKFNVELGGNIGTPVLSLKIKKNTFFIIEASSYQLSHSKFIHPDYAILLNITNDHIDWHGSMQSYTKSKLKIFNLQAKNDFALVNDKLKYIFKKNKYLSKLVPINLKSYREIKSKIKNDYLQSSANDRNMCFVFALAKLLKIKKDSFLKSMNSFIGLPHRYEVFFKKNNITLINDSKATSFESTKFALASCKDIFWIVGGLPKDKDKINLKYVKKNIVKSYIIGKNINFFKDQLKEKIKFTVSKDLKKSILSAFEDVRILKKKHSTILLSPAAASFDQFKNFEDRGNEFKKISRLYAKKFI